jgi:ATP/maltotriose-dependent transcriptional regulator MalT
VGLGDVDGAGRRTLALEERLTQGPEVMAFVAWALHCAGILCAAPDEQAWDKAEALLERVLSIASGRVWMPPIAQAILARVAFNRGRLEQAEELARPALDMLVFIPLNGIANTPPRIHALIGLGRVAEARAVAEQMLGTLQVLGGAGIYELEIRLAAVEAFEQSGDHDRARTELAETLRQVQLRADDIADPFWKESYLTRNPYVARALALGREWELPT